MGRSRSASSAASIIVKLCTFTILTKWEIIWIASTWSLGSAAKVSSASKATIRGSSGPSSSRTNGSCSPVASSYHISGTISSGPSETIGRSASLEAVGFVIVSRIIVFSTIGYFRALRSRGINSCRSAVVATRGRIKDRSSTVAHREIRHSVGDTISNGIFTATSPLSVSRSPTISTSIIRKHRSAIKAATVVIKVRSNTIGTRREILGRTLAEIIFSAPLLSPTSSGDLNGGSARKATMFGTPNRRNGVHTNGTSRENRSETSSDGIQSTSCEHSFSSAIPAASSRFPKRNSSNGAKRSVRKMEKTRFKKSRSTSSSLRRNSSSSRNSSSRRRMFRFRSSAIVTTSFRIESWSYSFGARRKRSKRTLSELVESTISGSNSSSSLSSG